MNFRFLMFLLLINRSHLKLIILRESESRLLIFRLKLINYYDIRFLRGFDSIDKIGAIKTQRSKSESINRILIRYDLTIRPDLQLLGFELWFLCTTQFEWRQKESDALLLKLEVPLKIIQSCTVLIQALSLLMQ